MISSYNQNIFINTSDKKLIISILKKTKNKLKKIDRARLMDFRELFRLLSSQEKVLIKKFLNVNFRKHGIRVPYFGIQKVPKNLIAIRAQKYVYKIKRIETQYLSCRTYLAYKKLNSALYKELGKRLLILSGYRSPAYQMIIFFQYLNYCNFNFSKAVKKIFLPGYSEHGYVKKQAIDFTTTESVSTIDKSFDFSKTDEYRWLLKNAYKFGFYLSYPRNNKFGVIFEPWHWRFGDNKLKDYLKTVN